jgi:hypothetical protein
MIRFALALKLATAGALPALAQGFPTSAGAQSYTFRDNAGRTTGTAAPMIGSGGTSYTLRDNAGRPVGTAVPQVGSGGYAIRDNAGRTAGTVQGRP